MGKESNKELYMNAFIVFDFWNVKYRYFGLFTSVIWVYCITIIYKVASVWICSSKHLILIKLTVNKTYNSSQPYSCYSLSPKKREIRDFWRRFWWNERPSPTLTQFKISAWGLKAENNLWLGVVELWNILQRRGQAAVPERLLIISENRLNKDTIIFVFLAFFHIFYTAHPNRITCVGEVQFSVPREEQQRLILRYLSSLLLMKRLQTSTLTQSLTTHEP